MTFRKGHCPEKVIFDIFAKDTAAARHEHHVRRCLMHSALSLHSRTGSTMMRWFLFLVFLVACTALAEAEKLSSGEDVKAFVDRHVQGYEVRSEKILRFGCHRRTLNSYSFHLL